MLILSSVKQNKFTKLYFLTQETPFWTSNVKRRCFLVPHRLLSRLDEIIYGKMLGQILKCLEDMASERSKSLIGPFSLWQFFGFSCASFFWPWEEKNCNTDLHSFSSLGFLQAGETGNSKVSSSSRNWPAPSFERAKNTHFTSHLSLPPHPLHSPMTPYFLSGMAAHSSWFKFLKDLFSTYFTGRVKLNVCIQIRPFQWSKWLLWNFVSPNEKKWITTVKMTKCQEQSYNS